MIHSWWNYHSLGLSDKKKAGMRIGYHYNFAFRENKWKDQGLVSRTERTEKLMDIMKSYGHYVEFRNLKVALFASQTDKNINLNHKDDHLKMWRLGRECMSEWGKKNS